MTINLSQLSERARAAVRSQDWATVSACANSILQQDANNPEGYFLTGLVERVSGRPVLAAQEQYSGILKPRTISLFSSAS